MGDREAIQLVACGGQIKAGGILGYAENISHVRAGLALRRPVQALDFPARKPGTPLVLTLVQQAVFLFQQDVQANRSDFEIRMRTSGVETLARKPLEFVFKRLLRDEADGVKARSVRIPDVNTAIRRLMLEVARRQLFSVDLPDGIFNHDRRRRMGRRQILLTNFEDEKNFANGNNVGEHWSRLKHSIIASS
jgi:hypothetical protein